MRNSSRTGSHRARVRIKVIHIMGNIRGSIRIIPLMGNIQVNPRIIPRTGDIQANLRIIHQTDSTYPRLRTICKIIHRITSTKIKGRETPMPLRFQARSFQERKRPFGGFFSVRKKVNL